MSAGLALKEGTAMGVPAFRRLWGAGLISDAGDWLVFIALPLMVLQLTGSAVGTSLAFLLELLPPVLLAPVVARVADRLPHRRVMLVAMLAQAVTLLPLLTVHDRSDLHVVYGVIVAQAVFAAFFEPAKSSLLPTLVGPERVTSANALVGLNNNVGRIIGGPLGGVLLAMGGLSVVALADIGTYLIAAALVLSLPRQEAAPAERLSLTRQEGTPAPLLGLPRQKAAPAPAPAPRRQGGETGGILGALADPATRALIVVDVVASIAQGLFVVLFVFFVTDVINGTAADVGLLRGVQAVGAILAGTVLGVLGARLNLLRLTLAGVVTFTVVTAITWNLSFVTHSVPVYAVLFAAMGVPAVFMGAGLTSLIQRAAAGARRGSAFAALGLGQAVGQAIGLLAAGLLHDSVGTLPLLEVQAGAYAAAAVLAVVLLPRATRPAGG
ncbi:MFS transporter [Winogradskya consettensis]|uniref:MFS transporter n=1 Tax=Winogradskya consettensis TaxID=113560 RepID=A0A919T1C3_9ACTN|nr:MFS transporter [Actinoplanes consettensis]GIM81134.1 MFS transporter [Actinoplanes consettensis]